MTTNELNKTIMKKKLPVKLLALVSSFAFGLLAFNLALATTNDNKEKTLSGRSKEMASRLPTYSEPFI